MVYYHNVVKTLIKSFDQVEFRHILREFNKEADQLANKALDDVDSKLNVNPNNSQEVNDLSNTIFNNHIIADESCTGFE